MLVKIYTDGASHGNPGIGAWGAILVSGKNRKWVGSASMNVTNNVAEVHALLEAVEALKKPVEIEWYTDSINAIGWIYGWDRKKKAPELGKRFKTKDETVKVVVEAVRTAIIDGGHTLTPHKVNSHTGTNLVVHDRIQQMISEYSLDEELVEAGLV